MCKFGIAIGASILAFTTAFLSQETKARDDATRAQEASARAAIAFTGDVITSFEVEDVRASVKWYREVLGCELQLDLSEMGWCEVTTPVTRSLIGLGHAEEGQPVQASGGAKLSLGVKDIAAARARLLAHGVACGEVVELPGLVKLLEFADPDGNRLMFHQDMRAE